jgi:hypothetical protein
MITVISHRHRSGFAGLFALLLVSLTGVWADDGNAGMQAQADKWIAQAKEWAAAPTLVNAVVAQNQQPPAAYAGMTQQKWAELSDTDPLVQRLMRNELAQFLRAKRAEAVTEAFVSDASGAKVAFLAKPTNWKHQGKPKHDEPMAGKIWQGKLELDRSSGMRQVQIAVPVLKDGTPVGSLVLGVALSALAAK